MEPSQKKKVKSNIEAAILSSEIIVAEYKEMTRPIPPENAIGRVSRMDAINNKSINEAAQRQAEQKLKSLKIALARIDESEFGICLKCQSEIPIGRILIRPHSRFCVKCAS